MLRSHSFPFQFPPTSNTGKLPELSSFLLFLLFALFQNSFPPEQIYFLHSIFFLRFCSLNSHLFLLLFFHLLFFFFSIFCSSSFHLLFFFFSSFVLVFPSFCSFFSFFPSPSFIFSIFLFFLLLLLLLPSFHLHASLLHFFQGCDPFQSFWSLQVSDLLATVTPSYSISASRACAPSGFAEDSLLLHMCNIG